MSGTSQAPASKYVGVYSPPQKRYKRLKLPLHGPSPHSRLFGGWGLWLAREAFDEFDVQRL
jgi:hypothetical protein